MLSFDFNFVLEMLNLAVLYLLLRKFLIGPITNIMEKRQAMIEEGLADAGEQKKKAYELRAQYEEALDGAREESRRMVEQAKKEAKKEYDRIVKDADAQAGRIVETARQNMDLEKERALKEVKTEVAALAMDAARKIVAEEYGGTESRAAYDQFLKEAGECYEDSKDR